MGSGTVDPRPWQWSVAGDSGVSVRHSTRKHHPKEPQHLNIASDHDHCIIFVKLSGFSASIQSPKRSVIIFAIFACFVRFFF